MIILILIVVYFDSKPYPDAIVVTSDLPDTEGRFRIIYYEKFACDVESKPSLWDSFKSYFFRLRTPYDLIP